MIEALLRELDVWTDRPHDVSVRWQKSLAEHLVGAGWTRAGSPCPDPSAHAWMRR